MLKLYSFFFEGVNVATTLASSLGNKNPFSGSNPTSVLYFSGTFHSNSRGILESFFTPTFYLLDTPANVGGKNNFPLLENDS